MGTRLLSKEDRPWYHKLVFLVTRQKGRYHYYALRDRGRAPWILGIYQRWLDYFCRTNGVSSLEF